VENTNTFTANNNGAEAAKTGSGSTFDLFGRSLFYVLSIELIVGGGGHLIDLGVVSIRMVLFALAMIVTVVYFVNGRRIAPDQMILTLGFMLMLGIGAVIGFINGSAFGAVWEDIKPQLYILLIPFLAFSITGPEVIRKLSGILRICAVAMAIPFIVVLLLMNTGLLPFLDFWRIAMATEEFFFRGEITFFYKGFLYLCIGFIFLIEGQAKKWQIAIVAFAIILTITRGFWVALLLTYGGYLLFFSGRNLRRVALGSGLVVSAVIIVVFGNYFISAVSKTIDREVPVTTTEHAPADPKPYLLGDRTHSDNERIRQINDVADRVTPVSAIIGHGLGQGIPTRPIHMEISYLEIFHKQGILGLVCWLLIFLVGVRKALAVRDDPASLPYFLSFVFVFAISLFNQFINNPIGLFIIMASIIAFDRLKTAR
jgi:hypothetical protein